MAFRLWLAAWRLLVVDRGPELGLPLLELRVLGLQSPSTIWPARASLAFWICSIWAWTFCTSGWPSLYFSVQAREVEVQRRDLAVEADHHRVRRHLGDRVEARRRRAASPRPA